MLGGPNSNTPLQGCPTISQLQINKETKALWVVHLNSRMIVTVNYQTHAHKVTNTNSKTKI